MLEGWECSAVLSSCCITRRFKPQPTVGHSNTGIFETFSKEGFGQPSTEASICFCFRFKDRFWLLPCPAAAVAASSSRQVAASQLHVGDLGKSALEQHSNTYRGQPRACRALSH